MMFNHDWAIFPVERNKARTHTGRFDSHLKLKIAVICSQNVDPDVVEKLSRRLPRQSVADCSRLERKADLSSNPCTLYGPVSDY